MSCAVVFEENPETRMKNKPVATTILDNLEAKINILLYCKSIV
jgi:hypothetical protein